MIAEDDQVAARFTMRGTHRGAFFGVPLTGRTIAVQAMNSIVWPVGNSLRNAVLGYGGVWF
jgi:predicted ester cyclase